MAVEHTGTDIKRISGSAPCSVKRRLALDSEEESRQFFRVLAAVERAVMIIGTNQKFN